jgi:hypothetical protein
MVLGTVEVIACQRVPPGGLGWVQPISEYLFGDYTPGRYVWIMQAPVCFPEPIPARGALGLWEWEPAGLEVL